MGRGYGRTGFYWNKCTDNYSGVTPATGANSANAPGVAFTAAANDVDGTAVTVLSALGHDVHRLVIYVGGIALSAANGNALGDLLVDPAGGTSWTSIWDDIICGQAPIPNAANGGMSCRYEVPLYIKSGTSIGFRAKCHHTSPIADGRITIAAFGEPSIPELWWCGERVETLGNGANSNGVLITPGNTGTFGSWTSVGSTTSYRYGAICFGAQGDGAGQAAAGYHFQIGYGSTQLCGTPTMWMAGQVTESFAKGGGLMSEFMPCDIPAGTQMQVRATQSASAANTPGVCLYGVAA